MNYKIGQRYYWTVGKSETIAEITKIFPEQFPEHIVMLKVVQVIKAHFYGANVIGHQMCSDMYISGKRYLPGQDAV